MSNRKDSMSKKIHDYPMDNNDWYEDDSSNTAWSNPGFIDNTNYIQTKLNKKNVNEKADITFIGDSVIDCKAYTKTGKGTVEYFAEIYANSTYMARINDQSRDGDTIYDCIDKANQINEATELVVVSAGGNDLLSLMPMIQDIDDTNLLHGLLISELDKLTIAYETMLQQWKQKNRDFLLLSVYEGNLAYNPQRFYGFDYTAMYDVLDLREFMSSQCYYNEIEPNDRGARRIAKHISRYINEHNLLMGKPF
jgi:hypothetical protein